MSIHHRIAIIGGGNAGISVAAQLRRKGQTDIGIIEPSSQHYYQPLWTLVGGGRAPARESVRQESSVVPQGVAWIKDSATEVDPENNTIQLASGSVVSFDYLIVYPGNQCDWDAIPGMQPSLETAAVSSNYSYDLAPKTWDLITSMRSGTAVFTMPTGAIKCPGAPQKIAYLAADYWREQGTLQDIRVVLVLPGPVMFGVKEFSDELEKVVARYGIEVRKNSEAIAIDPNQQTVTIRDNADGSSEDVHYDMLHVVPPQSAPDWVKHSPLADPTSADGYVEVDKHALQHTRYPHIFALGDVASSPNSKTGAAIRKQAPVVVENLLAVMAEKPPIAAYQGYASCPLTTSRHTMLLAEFDYSQRPAPSIPFINTLRERRDMWYLKRYGLPALYWNSILKGRA